MVSLELRKGISETLDILEHMDKEYTEKISESFKKFLYVNRIPNYVSNLDHTKRLDEMNLSKKTKEILAIISMKYWYSSEEQEAYKNKLNSNEIRRKEQLKQEHSRAQQLNSKVIKIEQDIISKASNENLPVETKKYNFIKRFILNIKRILHI